MPAAHSKSRKHQPSLRNCHTLYLNNIQRHQLSFPTIKGSKYSHLPNLYVSKTQGKVLHCLSSLAAKWKDIGIELGINPDSIDEIDEDQKSSRSKLTELIKLWLRQATPPPTWQALSDAVEQISANKAQEIRQLHGLFS